MISALFYSLIYRPLYSGFVFLVGAVPSHDVGIAVILITIVVRFILYPLSRRAIAAQLAMKKITPEIEALKRKFKDKPEEQGRAIFALYKERDIHPFAGIALILLQLPIMIGLYYVIVHGGLSSIDPSVLYSFVHMPDTVNMEFLGLIDMRQHSILLAVLAALSQLAYTRLSMGPKNTDSPVEASLSGDMAKSFEFQARYVLPAMVGVISFYLAAAAPLFWTTGNIFMLIQEYLSGKRFRGTPSS